MKPCFKCGVTKPLSEFYRHKMMADGHLNKCKECAKSDVRGNRSDKVEYYRDYDRGRSNSPDRIAAREAYATTEAGKESANSAKRRYAKRHKERRKAHVALGNAVKGGRIKRLPCEYCGASPSESHHPSYDMPLVVTWLCPQHHKQLHKEFRAYQRNHQQ